MRSSRLPSLLYRSAKWSFFGGCACHTLSQYLGSPWLLRDDSMEPTFRDGQVVFCTPWPWCGKVGIGDVVIFKHPEDPKRRICKRVTGQYLRICHHWYFGGLVDLCVWS